MKKDTHTYTASIAQPAHLSSYDFIETAHRLYAEAHIKGTLFVFNKIADQESETYLREELAKEGIKPLGVIREDKSISAARLRGKPLDMRAETETGQEIIKGIEAAERTCMH